MKVPRFKPRDSIIREIMIDSINLEERGLRPFDIPYKLPEADARLLWQENEKFLRR